MKNGVAAMTRNVVIIALMVCGLALSGCKDDAATQFKIATVDAEKVFQQSKLAAQGMSYVEELNSAMSKRMAEMQAELTARPDDQELAMRIQTEYDNLQKQLEQGQMAAAGKINDLFTRIVKGYIGTNGIEVILPGQVVIGARDGADITQQIIALMDKESIDFKADSTQNQATADQPAGNSSVPEQVETAPAPGNPAQ